MLSSYRLLFSKKALFFICFSLMFFACKQNNKTVENATICDEPNFDNYTFCEQYATAEEKAWEAKAVGLMQQIHLLFEAIKCSDIASADLYASKYGLGTLLYLNLKTIDTYKVLSYQISDKTATVHIKFNNKKTTTSCIFKQENEQPNTWFFHGINIYEAFSESGTKSRYGHKVKTQNVLP